MVMFVPSDDTIIEKNVEVCSTADVVLVKLELAKYYKDSEMTAFISERSRNSK